MAVNTALRQTITWRDNRGFTGRTTFLVGDDNTTMTFPHAAAADAQVIISDMEAISEADFAGATGPFPQVPAAVTYGANADYASIEDKVVFVFQAAAGDLHKVSVPSPLDSIFEADKVTVDKTNALVKQLIADILHQTFGGTAPTTGTTHGLYNRSILPFVLFVSGARKRVKQRRRINSFTRTPDLSGPDE